MKIAIVIPTLTSGGSERVAAVLANQLASKSENSVTVLKFEQGDSFYQLINEVRLISLDNYINRSSRIKSIIGTLRSYLKYSKFCKARLSEIKPDCVFSFLPHADIALYLAYKKSLPFTLVCSERNDPNERSPLLQKVLERIYRKCDLLICQSKAMSDYYKEIPDDRKAIIPNPIDCSVLPEVAEASVPPRIVAVGRLSAQKDFPLLINSFARSIPFVPPSTSLTIYGEGPQRSELERIIGENNLENVVTLPGTVSSIGEAIKDASLFVMSSKYEGFPNALLEAISLGLPVISTDFASGIARELVNPECGMLVPVGSERLMTEAIVKMLNSSKWRIAAQENAQIVRKRFDVTRLINDWLNSAMKAIRR